MMLRPEYKKPTFSLSIIGVLKLKKNYSVKINIMNRLRFYEYDLDTDERRSARYIFMRKNKNVEGNDFKWIPV